MAKKLLSDRVALRSAAELTALFQTLPDPDPVLRKMGKDVSTYRELLTDPRVGSNVENRQAGVLSMLWDIDRGSSKSRIAKFVAEAIGALDVYGITAEMLEAPLFGMKPMEIMWASDGRRTVPQTIDGLPQEWFLFDQQNHLRFRTTDNHDGIDLTAPEYKYKFLVPRYRATYANPYGTRVLSRVFWYVVFKRGALKFWVTFTEKYGMPWVFGKYRDGADDSEKDRLLEALNLLVQDGVGVLPQGDGVETIDVTTSGASANLYEKLLRFCNDESTIAILGHTGSSQGTPGRLGADDSAMDVRADIVDSDRRLVESTWNQLIRWMVDVNVGPQAQYPHMEFYTEEDVDAENAERDTKLHEIGVRFSPDYFIETYNLPEGKFTVDNTAQPAAAEPGADFAAAPGNDGQAEVDSLVDGLPAKLLQQQAEQILAPLIEFVLGANSLAEIQQKAADLYPNLDASELEQALERAMFAAETWGRMKGAE